MESNPGKRVRQLREAKGYKSLTAFSEFTDLKVGTLSALEADKSAPSLETLAKLLSAFPDVNMDWLVSGEGSMYKGASLTPAAQLPPPVPSKYEEKPAGFPQVPGTATPIEADFVGKYIRQLEEQLAKADADKEYLQGVVTELLGKSPASAYAATPVAERQVVTGFLTAASLPTGKVVAMWPGYSLAEKAA